MQKPREPLVQDRSTVATSFMTEGAGKIAFPRAGRSGNQQVLVISDPLVLRETHDQRFIQPATMFEVDVFEAGLVPELGYPKTGSQSAIVTLRQLAVD